MNMNMNMNRHAALKLFLLTATAVVFNNNAVSAFVVPSATTLKRQVTVGSNSVARQNLILRVADHADEDCADPECPDHFEDIQSAIDVMDKLQKGETGAIPDDHFVPETIVSKKPVCTEIDDDALDADALKELAESEESNNALDTPIDFLKNIMKGYKYIKTKDDKIEYSMYPRHYDVSKVKYSKVK